MDPISAYNFYIFSISFQRIGLYEDVFYANIGFQQLQYTCTKTENVNRRLIWSSRLFPSLDEIQQ